MSELYSQLQTLLTDVILPNLKGIHANQVEQRFQSDCLNQDLEDFRAEMRIQFAELRAELAACRRMSEREVKKKTTPKTRKGRITKCQRLCCLAECSPYSLERVEAKGGGFRSTGGGEGRCHLNFRNVS